MKKLNWPKKTIWSLENRLWYLSEVVVGIHARSTGISMRTDIEEGNFCEALLDKLGGEHQEEEKGMNSSPPAFIKDDIDGLQF